MSVIRRARWTLDERRRCEAGQSTLEYALVCLVLASIVGGLWALFRVLDAGTFVEHAVGSASHSISSSNAIGLLGDVLLH